MHRNSTYTVLAVIGSLAFADIVAARIKLITLPARERVEVRLKHQNATLVEEERIVPLVRGANQVDFSWTNTQVNPYTIVFRVVGETDNVRVLRVSYSPNEQALIWNVAADNAGPARVRISYLNGPLNKSFNYRTVPSKDESQLQL